jgi:HK97 family phage portal protein
MPILNFLKKIFTWRPANAPEFCVGQAKFPAPTRNLGGRPSPLQWLRTDYTIRNSELIFSAVSRIANTISAIPFRLYKGSAPVRNSLSDLIGFSPNPNMTASRFFKTMEVCCCVTGNAYALKGFDERGALLRLDVFDPTRVTPILEQEAGELWYRIRPPNGDEYYVHNFYVIHIPFISTNGYVGISPVETLMSTLEHNAMIERISLEQLKKGVSAKIVIEAPANLGEAQRAATIRTLMDTYKQTGGNILLLESGLTAKTLNMSLVDPKLLDADKLTRGKVAMVYNIPPHMLGDYSGSSFASQEQQMLGFLTQTILSRVTAYEQELTRKCVTRGRRIDGYAVKGNMDAILRADSATRAEVYQKAIRGGWMTPNEVRSLYGEPPDESGGRLLVSRDLTTLEWLVGNPDKGNFARTTQNSQQASASREV